MFHNVCPSPVLNTNMFPTNHKYTNCAKVKYAPIHALNKKTFSPQATIYDFCKSSSNTCSQNPLHHFNFRLEKNTPNMFSTKKCSQNQLHHFHFRLEKKHPKCAKIDENTCFSEVVKRKSVSVKRSLITYPP